MAISGRFEADFASFYDAVDRARIKLQGFETQGDKVSDALSKMVDSFSGRKILEEGAMLNKLFERTQDVALLTEKELEQVGARAAEAVEKMTKLGMDAPAGLQRLADAAKSAEREHKGLSETVRGLITDFAAMFTARAAISFVSDIIEEASALKNLSQQTHINVEELQIMSGAMSAFGVDANELGQGIYKLSRGIAGGDESVAHGLHIMGMSLAEVKGLNGQELFLKIESGLSKLQGGLRDTAAADLFGGKLGAAMAGASEGIEGTMETWRRLNHVASTESVDALEKFGASIAQAQRHLKSIAADMIGPVAEGFNVVVSAAEKGAPKWSIFVAMLKDFAASNSISGASAGNLAKLLDDLNQKTEEGAAKTRVHTAAQGEATSAIDKRSQSVKFMSALEADAAIKLTAAQIKDLEHLKEIGALNAKNAEGIGITTAQYNKYVAQVEAAKKAATELAQEHTKADAIIMATYQSQITALTSMETQRAKSYGTKAQIAMLDELDAAEQRLAKSVYMQLNSESERMKVILESGKQHTAITNQKMALEEKLLAITNASVLNELRAREQLNAAYGLDVQGHIKITSAAETLRLKLEDLHLTKQAGITQTLQEQILVNEYTKALYDEAIAQDRANAAASTTAAVIATGSEQIKKVTTDAAATTGEAFRWNFEKAQKAFEQFQGVVVAGTGILSELMAVTDAGSWAERNRQILEAQRQRGDIFLTGMSSGRLPIQTRQFGGAVSAGQPYIVGERGPELFRPTASGSIVPTGGGQPIMVQLVVDGRVLAEVVQQHTTRSVMRNTKLG